MEIEDDDYDTIDIEAREMDQLVPEQKERIIQDAKLDDQYKGICRSIGKHTVDENYSVEDSVLCWKGMPYAPERTRARIMKLKHACKVAGHFGRYRTMELITRYYYWPNMEDEVRKFCNECDNCQRTKAPRHAKHGLLHPLEMPSKPWTHISTDFITDLAMLNGLSNIQVAVDRCTKMAHNILIDIQHSPTVANAYLDEVWRYHGFPEDVVSDRDGTFTGQYFTDLYNFI